MRVVGKLAFVSGAGPAVINGRTFAGKVGAQVGLEEACEAARLCAVNLFVASGISGLSLEKMSKGIIPFVLLMCGLFVLIILVPEISTFIPALF